MSRAVLGLGSAIVNVVGRAIAAVALALVGAIVADAVAVAVVEV